jgi:5-methyltetrahydropteroyltriglutamate--homocysteine methyltransferase
MKYSTQRILTTHVGSLPRPANVTELIFAKERISGFEGDTPRSPPKDLLDFPSYLEKQARSGGTPEYKRPKCTGEIRPVNPQPFGRSDGALSAW